MIEKEDWISDRVSAAQKAHATVTEAAATRMKGLLKDQLCERQLRPTELTEAAKQLIADMTALASAKPEEKQ